MWTALRATTRMIATPRPLRAAASARAPARFSTAASGPVEEDGDHGIYAGVKVPYVRSLEEAVIRPESLDILPAYRVMNRSGELIEGTTTPEKLGLDDDTLVRMYECMLRLRTMDQIFYDAQRQGRISFYMTSSGEEATHVGSSAALRDDDMVYGQYREAGVLMWRGFTLQQFADQCFSNVGDPAKGRQMPVHYGSVELCFQTISSPLTTQLPQAAGAAYAYKLDESGRIVMCYFGDGAASEGDFHPALNMAATRECPMIFFCRNNGYAISTPVHDQYRGDGIASRGPGYGMATMRVDGNDLFAVYEATREARRIATEESRPVLIEAMTYRQGHHSTSDDSTRYRDVDEIMSWQKMDDPVLRLRAFLEARDLWTEEREVDLAKSLRAEVLAALAEAGNKEKAPLSGLFDDVYTEKPQSLIAQEREMQEHIAKYPDKYVVGDGH